MIQKLPTELILKIKHYTAIKTRLEKILRFPKLYDDGHQTDEYRFDINCCDHYFYLKCNNFIHKWTREIF